MNIKNTIRYILNLLHLDITKNLEYDRLTKKIIKQYLKNNSNCIDVGCHKGEILDIILKYAPNGKHYGFEPIPNLYKSLTKKYKNKAKIYSYALADKKGKSSFQLVKNAPAYSGLKRRRYDHKNPEIEEIEVNVEKLDNIIPKEIKIDLIKIDVEGGEFSVLKGVKETILRSKPLIIFEFGLGASDFYSATPNDVYEFLNKTTNFEINTLNGFLKKQPHLDLPQLEKHFENNSEYYFIAYKY